MQEKRWIQSGLLGLAALAIGGTIIAVACAPAAPNNQSEAPTAEKNTPTPSPTPETIWLSGPDGTPVPLDAPATPTPQGSPTPFAQGFKDDADAWQRDNAGRRTSPENAEWIQLGVETDTPERMEKAKKAMVKAGAVHNATYADEKSFLISTPMSRLRAVIEALEEVGGVVEINVPGKLKRSGRHRTGEPTATPGPQGATIWQQADLQGEGVRIGVIDPGFGGLISRIGEDALAEMHLLCFDQQGQTSTTASDCESFPDDDPHGTNVLRSMLDIAPNATYYISNPHNEARTKWATDWMLNQPGVEPTRAADQPVDVINASITRPWDGPGDGTSPFTKSSTYSLLNAVDDAEDAGAVWVSGAGNNGNNAWFSRTIAFHDDYLDFLADQPAINQCNMVNLTAGKTYEPHLRWEDGWPTETNPSGRDTDLDVQLYGPMDADGNRTQVIGTEQPISVDKTAPDTYPMEIRLFTPTETGEHCVYIYKEPGDATPDWIQLLIEDEDVVLAQTINNGQGSIRTPADSVNDALLAVGVIESPISTNVAPKSSRGPLPHATAASRVKPEVISLVRQEYATTTSNAAPRVTALVALAIQALQSEAGYSSPSEFAQYIKNHAEHLVESPDPNEWGHGLARLPGPPPPTNVRLERIATQRASVSVRFDDTDWDALSHDESNVAYKIKLVKQVPNVTGGTVILHGGVPGGHYLALDFHGLEQGETYYAIVATCPGNAPSPLCGEYTEPSDTVYIPHTIEPPTNIIATPGDRTVTLRWDPSENADTYLVEYTGPDPLQTSTTSDTSIVITGLTNDEFYSFSIYARGAPGTSDPSLPVWARPDRIVPPVPQIRSTARRQNGTTVRIRWTYDTRAAQYRIQLWDGEARKPTWRTLGTERPQTGPPHRIDELTRISALISGLDPAKGYVYRIKAINGPHTTRWTRAESPATTTPISPVPTPAPPPDKNPATNLMATVAGTTVTLTWTKPTNPNFESIQVLRRVAAERPIDWTIFTVDDVEITSYTDTTAVSGTTYIYRVEALKANGKGGMTNPVEIAIP